MGGTPAIAGPLSEIRVARSEIVGEKSAFRTISRQKSLVMTISASTGSTSSVQEAQQTPRRPREGPGAASLLRFRRFVCWMSVRAELIAAVLLLWGFFLRDQPSAGRRESGSRRPLLHYIYNFYTLLHLHEPEEVDALFGRSSRRAASAGVHFPER